MVKSDTLTDYNKLYEAYDSFRNPNPFLVEKLKKSFKFARKLILSIGCGTGKYEEKLFGGCKGIGFDKSRGMLNLATKRIPIVVQGNMLNLPFKENSFSGVFFMQSLHHLGGNLEITSQERVKARKQALKEAARVLDRGPLLIFQRDPQQNQAVWFWHYFPQAIKKKLIIQTKISNIVDWLKEMEFQHVHATPIYDQMIEGFFDPMSPLKQGFRDAFSEFSYLSESEYYEGMEKLKADIKNGNVYSVIAGSKNLFKKLGGTIFMVSAIKK